MEPKKKSYLIANYSIDHNKTEKYATYPQKAIESTKKYGGRVLVATKDSIPLEGTPENITVVLEFNSQKELENWYNSEEYNAIKELRTETTISGWVLTTKEF